ncbi:glyoxal reductase [Pontibacillus chungwhensis BH030062]|uniref:Glyoxal reductase n=1 Tax=Pontibacillus chungwhensis BH030062 TaxID=1385513 RepID=A0A0A2VCM0_9BACI|nr:aldo/keto reductase [Pontibacillus chungwhensis]KGP91375.1 glyoxal reductase [Pontibacillus chungwhensis BH030062]
MIMNSLQDTIKLNNGVDMPRLGLGVFKAEDGEEVINAVKWALEHGYRSIDTAAAYKNEEGVGQALKDSGLSRDEIFVTSKLWNSDQGYEETLQAFETSLEKLGLDYLDLYLIHWPVEGKYKESWKAMEKLYHDGKIRAIGVSNFHPHHLDDLLKDGEVTPVINQVELHPKLAQQEVRDYCEKHDIVVEAWSPLMQGQILEEPVIQELAQKYNKTAAQIVIRWDLQIGIVTIPKSTKQHRIQENADVFDFELTDEEVVKITELNENHRVGPDPDNFDF